AWERAPAVQFTWVNGDRCRETQRRIERRSRPDREHQLQHAADRSRDSRRQQRKHDVPPRRTTIIARTGKPCTPQDAKENHALQKMNARNQVHRGIEQGALARDRVQEMQYRPVSALDEMHARFTQSLFETNLADAPVNTSPSSTAVREGSVDHLWSFAGPSDSRRRQWPAVTALLPRGTGDVVRRWGRSMMEDVAPDAEKVMDEQPAPEEGAELALDEAGQPDPVGVRGGRGEEGLQMLLNHRVQDRVGGGSGDVGSHGAGSSAFHAVPAAPPAGNADDERPEVIARRGATASQPSVARTHHRNGSPATDYDRGPVMADRWQSAASKT